MMLKEEQEIIGLIEDYFANRLNLDDFLTSFRRLIPKLDSKLDEWLYYPLKDIADSKYFDKLPKFRKLEILKEAVDFIPKAAFDRDAKKWIENNLIEDEELVFMDQQGSSKFGAHEILYQAPLKRMSFIMSALTNGLPSLEYSYEILIDKLRSHTLDDTIWVRSSMCDGYPVIDSTSWYTNESDEIENISWLEHTSPQETQWGECHLLFMPSNYEWLLLHTNDYESFSISLHGNKTFIKSILKQVRNA